MKYKRMANLAWTKVGPDQYFLKDGRYYFMLTKKELFLRTDYSLDARINAGVVTTSTGVKWLTGGTVMVDDNSKDAQELYAYVNAMHETHEDTIRQQERQRFAEKYL